MTQQVNIIHGKQRGGELLSFDVETEIDYWLNTIWAEETGIYVDGVFSYDFYESFESTDEFITWFNS